MMADYLAHIFRSFGKGIRCWQCGSSNVKIGELYDDDGVVLDSMKKVPEFHWQEYICRNCGEAWQADETE